MRALFIALVATGLAMLTLGMIADAISSKAQGLSFNDRLSLTVLINQCVHKTHLCPKG